MFERPRRSAVSRCVTQNSPPRAFSRSSVATLIPLYGGGVGPMIRTLGLLASLTASWKESHGCLFRCFRAKNRAMIGKQRGSDTRRGAKNQILDSVFHKATPAGAILVCRTRRIGNGLRQHPQVTGLNQPPDCLPGIKIDMPYSVKNKIWFQPNRVLQRNLNKNVRRNPSGFLQQSSRILYMLEDVADDRQIEPLIIIGYVISIKELAFSKVGDLSLHDCRDCALGNLHRIQ